MPLLKWQRDVENPCFIDVYSLSDLGFQTDESTTSCLIVGSFSNAESQMFCSVIDLLLLLQNDSSYGSFHTIHSHQLENVSAGIVQLENEGVSPCLDRLAEEEESSCSWFWSFKQVPSITWFIRWVYFD